MEGIGEVKGKVVSFEGIKDEYTGTLGKTWASDIDSALEFHPVNWVKISQYLTEWKEKYERQSENENKIQSQ